MIAAMKAKDPLKVNTLRGLMAAMTNELVAAKKKPDEEVPEEMAVAAIRREVKKRKKLRKHFAPEIVKNQPQRKTRSAQFLKVTSLPR